MLKISKNTKIKNLRKNENTEDIIKYTKKILFSLNIAGYSSLINFLIFWGTSSFEYETNIMTLPVEGAKDSLSSALVIEIALYY